MNNQILHNCNRLQSEIQAEMKLLSDFNASIDKIKSVIQSKNWQNLEKLLDSLHVIAEKVENMEAIRSNTFSAILLGLQLSPDATLHAVLSHLDYEQQQKLSELHLQLKQKVLKVKIEYQNLGYYVRNLSGFIYKFLEEVFPHTKGKIYSRQGKAALKPPESIMINKKL